MKREALPKSVRRLLALVALVYAGVSGLHTVGDFDTGWLIATGRWAWQHRQFPATDVLSYTTAGAPWPYPSLGGVLFYGIFSAADFTGLEIFCAIVCTGLIAWMILRAPDGGLGTVVLAILAVPSLVYRTTPRADLFTTVLFTLMLLELWRLHCGRSTKLWSLPIFLLLWVNLHPGYVAGLALLAAYGVMEALELPFAERRDAALRRLRRAWPWLLASAACTLLNPWGIAMLRSALQLSTHAGHESGVDLRGSINEWSAARVSWAALRQALDLHNGDASLWWLLAATVLCAGLAVWRRHLGAALLLLAASYAAVHTIRWQALFAIVAVILGGSLLHEAGELAAKDFRLARGARWLAQAAAAACLLLVSVRVADLATDRAYVYAGDVSDFGLGESWWYPERAVAYIERAQLPGNVFETFNLGGFTALRLAPRYLNYNDSRGISGDLLREEQRLLASSLDGEEWRRVAGARNIQTILLTLGRNMGLQSLNLAAFCNSRQWAPVYMDEVSLVLVRRSPQNRTWREGREVNCATVNFAPPVSSSRAARYQFYANAGAVLFLLRRDAEALAQWNAALALFPCDPNVNLYLAQLDWQHGDLRAAETHLRAALRQKENAQAAYLLGRLLATEHRWQEAEGPMQLAAGLSTTPANAYKALAQIQLKNSRPSRALRNLRQAEHYGPSAADESPSAHEFRAQLAEGRAEAARQQGDLRAAVALQQQAVQETPQSSARWQALATLAQAAGDTPLAAEAAAKAAQLAAAAP